MNNVNVGVNQGNSKVPIIGDDVYIEPCVVVNKSIIEENSVVGIYAKVIKLIRYIGGKKQIKKVKNENSICKRSIRTWRCRKSCCNIGESIVCKGV